MLDLAWHAICPLTRQDEVSMRAMAVFPQQRELRVIEMPTPEGGVVIERSAHRPFGCVLDLAIVGDVDWATLATDLGYADQAHLTSDFTAKLGVPPSRYAAEGR